MRELRRHLKHQVGLAKISSAPERISLICLDCEEILKTYSAKDIPPEFGSRYGVWAVLKVVRVHPGLSGTKIAEDLKRRISTVSPMLGWLKEQGYATSQRSNVDTRAKTWWITPEGERFFDDDLE